MIDTMKTYTATDAKREFGEVLLHSQQTPVCVTRNGKPVAVMMSHSEFESLKLAVLTAAPVEGENSGLPQLWDAEEFLMRMKHAADADGAKSVSACRPGTSLLH